MNFTGIYIFFGFLFSMIFYSFNQDKCSNDFLGYSTSYMWKPPTPWIDYSISKNQQKSNSITINIKTDEINLFDYFKGIYISGISSSMTSKPYVIPNWLYSNGNYDQRTGEWKRNSNLTIYKNNKSTNFKKTTIEIHGNRTRTFPQKSLSVKFNKKDLNKLNSDVVSGSGLTLILRNGGNDWGNTFCRDALVQNAIEKLNLENQFSTPVNLYVNNQFFGLHFAIKKIDVGFLKMKYNVKKSKITIIDQGWLQKGKSKGLVGFRNAISELKSLNPNDEFNKIKGFDPIDFLNFTAINIITANQDWPNNNIRCYSINDTLFKFIYYDFDMTNGFTNNAFSYDVEKQIMNRTGWFSDCFKVLVKNKSFKEALHKKIVELINSELSANSQISSLKNLSAQIDPIMDLQCNRWRFPSSKEIWHNNLQHLQDYIKGRSNFLVKKYSERNNKK